MNQKFDWQAEDNEQLVDAGSEKNIQDQRIRRRRRVFYLVILLLLLSTGFISLQRVERFVGETGVEIEQEILTSNELVLKAARGADPEILANLISGRDPIWAEAQLALVESGFMFGRSPFGFELRDESIRVVDVVVSPEFNSAEVIIEVGYDFLSTADATETIYLEQSLHYRRSDDRWLLSPPVSDYWGESVVEEGYYLTLRHFDRDSSIGERLALDLESLVAAFCNNEQAALCSTGLPIQVSLVTDPASITNAGKLTARYSASAIVQLPSPTIFGVPGSEKAYRALSTGYGELLASYLLAVMSENA